MEDGKARVDIEETELIGNSEKVLWLFGIIVRATKEVRVFSVMTNSRRKFDTNNRTKCIYKCNSF